MLRSALLWHTMSQLLVLTVYPSEILSFKVIQVSTIIDYL